MEETQASSYDLKDIDPTQWANVPSVLTHAIHAILNEFKDLRGFRNEVKRKFEKCTSSWDHKFQNYRKSITKIEAQIKNSQESVEQQIVLQDFTINHKIQDWNKMNSILSTETRSQIADLKENLDKHVEMLTYQLKDQTEKQTELIYSENENILERARKEIIEPEYRYIDNYFKDLKKILDLQQEMLNKDVIDWVSKVNDALSHDLKMNKDIQAKLKQRNMTLETKLDELDADVYKRFLQVQTKLQMVQDMNKKQTRIVEQNIKTQTKEMRRNSIQIQMESKAHAERVQTQSVADQTAPLRDEITKITKNTNKRIEANRNEFELKFKELEKWKVDSTTKMTEHIQKLDDKLSWFPTNELELQEAPVSKQEARMFALESRLRQEEKNRLMSQEFMRAELEHIKTSTAITVGKLGREVTKNYTRLQAFSAKSPEPAASSRRMIKTSSDRHSVPQRHLIETSQSPMRRKLIRMRTPTTTPTINKTIL